MFNVVDTNFLNLSKFIKTTCCFNFSNAKWWFLNPLLKIWCNWIILKSEWLARFALQWNGVEIKKGTLDLKQYRWRYRRMCDSRVIDVWHLIVQINRHNQFRNDKLPCLSLRQFCMLQSRTFQSTHFLEQINLLT